MGRYEGQHLRLVRTGAWRGSGSPGFSSTPVAPAAPTTSDANFNLGSHQTPAFCCILRNTISGIQMLCVPVHTLKLAFSGRLKLTLGTFWPGSQGSRSC